jgi:hypothetical protein
MAVLHRPRGEVYEPLHHSSPTAVAAARKSKTVPAREKTKPKAEFR